MKALAVYCDKCGFFIRKANEQDAVKHALGDSAPDLCGVCNEISKPRTFDRSRGYGDIRAKKK